MATTVSNPVHIAELVLPKDGQAAREQLKPLAEDFKLHPLTVDDCLKRNQRCKLETFDHYLFLVWHLYTPEREQHRELHFCIGFDRLLIVAEELPPEGASWREYLLRHRGENCALKQTVTVILDQLVEAAEGYLDVVQEEAAALERQILERYIDPDEVVYLKGLVRVFSRSMRSAQPIFSQLTEFSGQIDQIGAFSPDERLRLRNVTDHMTRLLEATQLLDGQMGTLMDVHWGALSARTNRQMQRLTTIATILLPVGFWSGLFGMNFETMPFKEHWFFACGMVALFGTWLTVLFYMRKRGMFDHELPSRRETLFAKKGPLDARDGGLRVRPKARRRGARQT